MNVRKMLTLKSLFRDKPDFKSVFVFRIEVAL